MKKLVSLIAVFALTLSFAGCMGNNTVTYNPEAPYWQDDTAAAMPATFSEICNYSVDYAPLQEKGNETVSVTLDKSGSYYKTTVAHDVLGEQSCSVLTVETRMKGEYSVKSSEEGKTEPEAIFDFDDYSVSKTWFTWNGGIQVIKTVENSESTLPVNAIASEDKNGNRFIKLACKITTEYGDTDALTKVEITGDKEKSAPYFSLKDGYEGTFKKYKSTNYVDRNMLAFALRTFNFDKDMTYSFSTIDVLGNKKHTMKYSVSATEPSEAIKNLKQNGTPLGTPYTDESGSGYVFSPATFEMKIAVNETYGGTPMVCKYVTGEKKDNFYYHYMYTMTTNIPYSLGTYTYTLTSIDRTK